MTKTKEKTPEKLRLRAEDEEDLAVISAVLQDALVAVADMTYQPGEQRFVLVANRFRHECSTGERVTTGLRIDHVSAVKRRGFTPAESDRILVLLAIRAEPGAILLDFAGGACIRLESGSVLCHLDDFGEPWPTRFRPRHPVG
jgi:Protein of unknown function (DUF2948)